jgi:hypothetical protein
LQLLCQLLKSLLVAAAAAAAVLLPLLLLLLPDLCRHGWWLGTPEHLPPKEPVQLLVQLLQALLH